MFEQYFLENHFVQPISEEEAIRNQGLLEGRDSNILSPNWTTSYSEIKSELKTGDVILVHGKYPFSWVVQLLQWSKWGHSAIVIRASDIDPGGELKLPDPLLWESNTGDQEIPNHWGPQRGKAKEGPMLISLEERLKRSQSHYPGVEIVYRPLFTNREKLNVQNLRSYFDKVIDKKFPTELEIIYSIYLGRKYNRSSNDPLREMRLLINPLFGTIDPVNIDINYINKLSDQDIDKDKIYCSELVAATFKQIGLLTEHHVSNAYSPKDFSSDGEVRFLKGFWIGGEMYLNMFK